MSTDFTKLRRPRYPIPEDVRLALDASGLTEAYHSRPAYQQNDTISWITRARLVQTRQKRLTQMLDELRAGGVYMGMDHPASRKRQG